MYALSPAPDGSVWGTTFGFPGAVIRLSPGANPPHTAITEVFEGRLPPEQWHSPLWKLRHLFVNPLAVRFFDRLLGVKA